MSAIKARICLVTTAMSLIGCMTTTRDKMLRDMTIAASAGAIAGQLREDNQGPYSVMYAGTAAALTAGVDLLIYNPDHDSIALKKENEELRQKLDEAFAPRLEQSLPGTLGGRVPEKYRDLITPGAWRVFSLDQWVDEGENRLIHQDKIIELVPPSLKPIQVPLKNKKKENP